MSTNKIETYIQRTNMEGSDKNLRYTLYLEDVQALYEMIREGRSVDAISLCFQYGKAKGREVFHRLAIT